ncbi:MAG: TraB/GumN family protein [Coraliomargaritaceae bacterium]
MNFAQRRSVPKILTLGFCFFFSLFQANDLSAQSPVWKVSRGDCTFYLGGTCHLLRATDYPLPEAFDLAYKKADRLVFEVSPEELQDTSTAARMMQKGVYPENKSLRDVLEPEVLALLAEQGQRHNLPIFLLESFKPGLAVILLTMQELVLHGISEEGVDLHFSKRAAADGKPTAGLETIAFQVNLLCEMGTGYENEFVRYSLNDLEKLGEEIGPMLTAWRMGNTTKLEKLFLEDLQRYPKLYHDLVVARNQRWLQPFEGFLDSPETEFVLVGFGHLVGKDGLIQLLRSRNCTVECMSTVAVDAEI